MCEDSLICDLAETYHILNYKELSPDLVATLLVGLKDDSRVKMIISKTKLTIDQILMAVIVDKLDFISWTFTKDARKGRPYNNKSILRILQGQDKKDDLVSFSTVEEFEAYMKQFEDRG